MARTDHTLLKFARDAWVRTKGNPRADLGEVLYLLDSAHFADFLHKYRSAEYEQNVGARISVSFIRFDYAVDPRTRESKFTVGVALAK